MSQDVPKFPTCPPLPHPIPLHCAERRYLRVWKHQFWTPQGKNSPGFVLHSLMLSFNCASVKDLGACSDLVRTYLAYLACLEMNCFPGILYLWCLGRGFATDGLEKSLKIIHLWSEKTCYLHTCALLELFHFLSGIIGCLPGMVARFLTRLSSNQGIL